MSAALSLLRAKAPPVPSPLRGEGDFDVSPSSQAVSLARPIKPMRDAVAPLPARAGRVRVGTSIQKKTHDHARYPIPGGRHDRH